ncbi:alpha/beta-hydrolase [Xylariaceae sp. AK1471]|nr:alpha/beta-hydrolase [Xylariaceae sp. AK1471]
MAVMAFTSIKSAFLVLAVSFIVTAEPIVKLQDRKVTYEGITSDNHIEHFLNIKYAHDTSGARRFAPPEPFTPPEGTHISAIEPGPACPQSKAGIPPFFDETPVISEDCLNLRIARPAGTTANDKLPVVVWLHGGGVVKGSAYDSHFNPDQLIMLSSELKKPVIYVSLHYRITIFGFARLATLKAQKSLNVGMRDQRLGFQWVKDNIAAFGGDPNRIIAYGLSAGGTFSSLQLLAYGGEKGVPFTHLWSMSGPPGNALNVTTDATEMHTRAVAENLGCGTGDEDDEKMLECLREVHFEKLTEAAMEYSIQNHPPNGLHTFIPSIDGDIMPDRHSVLYKSGKFVKGIPTVFGWAHDDGSGSATPASAYQTEEDMKGAFKPFTHALTDDDYRMLFSLYPGSDFEEEFKNYGLNRRESDPTAPIHFFRVSRMLRDILFTCSSLSFGYEMSRQSKALDPAFPGVRMYDLNQSMLTPLMGAAGLPYMGVCHGSDTHYIFNGLFPEGKISESDQSLSRSMTGSFINFAYTGNPTFPDDEHFSSWPESFPEPSHHEELLPSSLNLQLIGGPFGTGFGTLKAKDSADSTISAGIMQDMMGQEVEYKEMGSAASQARQRVIEREKLLERCAYIDTLAEKLGV